MKYSTARILIRGLTYVITNRLIQVIYSNVTSTTCAVIREWGIEKPVLFQYENLIIQCAKGLFLLKMFATWFQVTLCDRSHLQTFDARLPFVCGEVTESTGVGNIANECICESHDRNQSTYFRLSSTIPTI